MGLTSVDLIPYTKELSVNKGIPFKKTTGWFPATSLLEKTGEDIPRIKELCITPGSPLFSCT